MHKTASRRLEHALNLHLSRWLPAGTYKLSGDLGLHRRVSGGDPYQVPVPDIIVYLQAPDMQGRQSFRLEEDGPPDLVLEILSARTWKRDIGNKRTLYETMGIGEYWLYDPGGRCLRGAARVQGFRLVGTRYAAITPEPAPGRLNGARQPMPLWRSAVLQTAWGLDAQAELRLSSRSSRPPWLVTQSPAILRGACRARPWRPDPNQRKDLRSVRCPRRHASCPGPSAWIRTAIPTKP